jgi:hypothetical protein
VKKHSLCEKGRKRIGYKREKVEERGIGLYIGHSSRYLAWESLEGFGGTLDDKTMKGCGINSFRESGFNNLGARAINSVGTTQPSRTDVMSRSL